MAPRRVNSTRKRRCPAFLCQEQLGRHTLVRSAATGVVVVVVVHGLSVSLGESPAISSRDVLVVRWRLPTHREGRRSHAPPLIHSAVAPASGRGVTLTKTRPSASSVTG
mmetsp:Transcript_4357/g.17673  ORF Transcript_4357/g.17673 Transcript_4357/m.17673 type:complete len:109 (+) Transcript_4357:953-1279(+)